MLRRVLVFVLLAVLIVTIVPLAAQDDAVATGLNNPRHITFGPDGTLYIAEAGKGGDIDAEGPFAAVKIGFTSQVSAVSPEGEQSVVIPELISMDNGFGQIEGATSLHVTEDSYWVVLGMGPKEVDEGSYVESVVQIDPASMEVLQVVDLGAYEEANNPDATQELVSNPIDIAVAEDGTVYIADASGNALYSWTADGGLVEVAVWQPGEETQSVPSAVAVGPDGSIYVGFLSGFPFAAGSARIEKWSADGELVETYSGLTLITDVLVTSDGAVYAVEMASGFGDAGFIPDSGRVISVTDMAVAMDGLNFPYGLAQNADGAMFVTVNSAFVAPDSGSVIPVAMGEMTPMEPMGTPEASG